MGCSRKFEHLMPLENVNLGKFSQENSISITSDKINLNFFSRFVLISEINQQDKKYRHFQTFFLIINFHEPGKFQ